MTFLLLLQAAPSCPPYSSKQCICSPLPSIFLRATQSFVLCVSWAAGFSSAGACSKAGRSLKACVCCKRYAGNCCSISCSTLGSTIAPRLSNHCCCAQLLNQCYQNCFRKAEALTTQAYLSGSAWQCLKAPKTGFFLSVPSHFLNKCDIPFAPLGWKLSFLSG